LNSISYHLMPDTWILQDPTWNRASYLNSTGSVMPYICMSHAGSRKDLMPYMYIYLNRIHDIMSDVRTPTQSLKEIMADTESHRIPEGSIPEIWIPHHPRWILSRIYPIRTSRGSQPYIFIPQESQKDPMPDTWLSEGLYRLRGHITESYKDPMSDIRISENLRRIPCQLSKSQRILEKSHTSYLNLRGISEGSHARYLNLKGSDKDPKPHIWVSKDLKRISCRMSDTEDLRGIPCQTSESQRIT
jgi:hypothetical protein